MNENLNSIRLKDLDDHIRKDLEMLKELEDELRIQPDPVLRRRYLRDIERYHNSWSHYQQEYDELQVLMTPAEMQHISNLLKQNEAKLAYLQKLLPPIWNLTHIRNPNFTGREQVLAELRESLISGDVAAWKQAITGIGGVGKTQIAVEYVYRHKADYKVVWWVRSEEPATLVADYAGLAAELDLPVKDYTDQSLNVNAVKRWLERNSDWLLIFDNAESQENLKNYIPQGGAGHIIITSRNPKWSNLAKKLPIQVFDRAESTEFLLKRTGQKNQAEANKLADALGDLPLALEQAGAYIEETGVTLMGYLSLFKKRQQEILEHGQPIDYPAPVATTWDISFEKASDESKGLSADILNLCAFLAPDGIPRSLFAKGAKHLPEPLASATEDEIKFNDAVKALMRYSLLNVSGNEFSVHRLVQTVTRYRLTQYVINKWSVAAVQIVNDAFYFESDEVQTWDECSCLLSHALDSTKYATDLEVASEATWQLLNKIGLYLKERAKFAEAKLELVMALEIGKKVYGPDSPEVARTLDSLGLVLQDLGELDSAKKLHEKALSIVEKVYGPDHPAVGTVLNDLGKVLYMQEDLESSKKCIQRSLYIGEIIYGTNHAKVAIRHNNLGRVLQDLGDHESARLHYDKALSIGKNVYGLNHPIMAAFYCSLGKLYQVIGQPQNAKENYEKALEIDEQIYHGRYHPEVATDINYLGRALQDLGDLENAKKNFELALEIDEVVYHPDHYKLARDAYHLGIVLRDLDDLDGAEKNLERALKINETTYDPNHRYVTICRDDLAQVKHKLSGSIGTRV